MQELWCNIQTWILWDLMGYNPILIFNTTIWSKKKFCCLETLPFKHGFYGECLILGEKDYRILSWTCENQLDGHLQAQLRWFFATHGDILFFLVGYLSLAKLWTSWVWGHFDWLVLVHWTHGNTTCCHGYISGKCLGMKFSMISLTPYFLSCSYPLVN